MGVSSGVPSKVVATAFALTGFAVALVAGLAAGNTSMRILTAALISMVVCHLLGLIGGAIGERVVNEHLSTYRAGRPVPEFKREPATAAEAPTGKG